MSEAKVIEVVVAPGRSVTLSDLVAPARFSGSGDERVIVRSPVMDERVAGPGEHIWLPEGEATHMISAGFVSLPGEQAFIPYTSGPKMPDDFDLASDESGAVMPSRRKSRAST